MSKPSLSIIMPVYNAEKYLSPAIQSALNQTYKDLELIIINDGSSDKSKVVIESFDDSRIKYFENKQNSGIVFSRNRGLELARGDFIGMLDADDIAYPNKFEEQITFLQKNREYGMVGSWARFIDDEGKPIPGSWKLTASPEMIPSIMLFKNYFLQSAVLYRKECINKFSFKKGFEIGEDYLIWYEIIKNYKAWNLQKFLVKYRIHVGGVTKLHQENKLEMEKEIFRIQLKDLKIEASDHEMKMHLLIHNEKKIYEISTLQSIEKWLLKILKKNKSLGIYDQKMLKKVVFNRWLKACYKIKDSRIKAIYHLLTSKIFFTFIKS